MSDRSPPDTRFTAALLAILAASFLIRLAYIAAQSSVDPTYAFPIMDGGYYLDWARALADGEPGPPGAYYLAPLFPYALAVFLSLFGESFGLLYGLQHAATLAGGGLLALLSARSAGRAAGLATAGLLVLYHPLAYFSSRPLSEPPALLLLSIGLLLVSWRGRSNAALAFTGVCIGLASLARPSFLLVAVFWITAEVVARRLRHAGLLAAGLLVVLAPVAARNLTASGHLVAVSSNAGVTAYHGNSPGALGTYTPVDGLSGSVGSQREEATAFARQQSGLDLDAVEADRWWGRQALRARMDEPLGTAGLLLRKAFLLVDSHEHALGQSPALDPNPWRRAFPLPWALLLGLALYGAVARGPAGSGGWRLWSALLATAVTPLLFYVSSRYRLPVAALLCVPGGAGLVGLVSLFRKPPALRRVGAAAGAGLIALLSLSLGYMEPSRTLIRHEAAQGLSNRAYVLRSAGRLDDAEALVREALRLEPSTSVAHLNLGWILEARGRESEAVAAYLEALRLEPGRAEAAANLAALLIRRGRPEDAVGHLRRALEHRPSHAQSWTNLVVALVATGQRGAARQAARDAGLRGVTLEAALIEMLQAMPGDTAQPVDPHSPSSC